MSEIKLGDRVSDKVTGFAGTVQGLHQYIYCGDMATVQPPVNAEGEWQDSRTFYLSELEILSG